MVVGVHRLFGVRDPSLQDADVKALGPRGLDFRPGVVERLLGAALQARDDALRDVLRRGEVRVRFLELLLLEGALRVREGVVGGGDVDEVARDLHDRLLPLVDPLPKGLEPFRHLALAAFLQLV